MPTIEELEDKLNKTAVQYEQVVKQNQSLQQELKEVKKLALQDPVSLRDILVSECVMQEYENETRDKIVEFLKEMSSQDNRGTAFPYYYTIADERVNYVDNEKGEYFFDEREHCYRQVRVAAEIYIRENNICLDDILDDYETISDFYDNIGTVFEHYEINDWLKSYNNSDYVNRYEIEYDTYYEGVFLTEKDAEAYLESASNHHFGPNPRTYVDTFNKWGRHSKTEEFLRNLFDYFGVKVPPKMYYESKGVDYNYD